MRIVKWVGSLIDTINSWEECIALSVMITGGGCALILLIFVYSHLYKALYPHQYAQHHRQSSAQIIVPLPEQTRHYHFGRPRDLDSRGSEARAAGLSHTY